MRQHVVCFLDSTRAHANDVDLCKRDSPSHGSGLYLVYKSEARIGA